MYTIAVYVSKVVVLPILIMGAAATLRKWIRRNDKKTLLDLWLVIRSRWLVLMLASAGYLALLLGCSYAVNQKMMPAFSLKLNYEEASKGLFPNKTRFNASELLSDEVLEATLQGRKYGLEKEELAECLQISSTYDETQVDELSPKIATEYQISFTDKILSCDIDTDLLIEDIASASREAFLKNHSENTAGALPDMTGVEGLDYAEIKDRLSIEAQKLKRFMGTYQAKTQTFRNAKGQTFQSLSKELDDYINVGLEEYGAFVRENGITRRPDQFVSTAEYTNRLLQVNYGKKLASYKTRIDAVHMYDGKMASVVMVPTDDASGEFYMSRTKIGVDYFAEEANAAINDAASIKTRMDNREYTRASVLEGRADESDYIQVNAMARELISELNDLTDKCLSFFTLYQMAGREPLVGINVYHPEIDALLSTAGIPEEMKKLTQLENGLVLACGVKGCGKSTTIAAILQEINTARRCHILTIEDPIEYLFRHDKSIVDQREVGLDCGSYAAGIRAAAREDPDVIFVGELRDKETIDATLSAAETGHLVFSTIHCTGLSDMTGRILHAFDGSEQPRVREQLMSVLKGVVAPGLIRYADGNITPVFSVLGEKETEKLF